ncbi:MAG: hypothetical protein HOC71_07595, partial [Candidatus Latescibacteria bacterium]|nr:hypothetical protein [Candidatus Latescibacterota bacterium]
MKYEKIKKSHKASLLIIKIFVVCGLRMNTGFSNEMKPLINEVMPSIVTEKDGNTTWGLSNAVYRNYNYYRDPSEIPSIPDEDGDYSDWIEIFNPSSSPVDLTGYGLSDRPSNPFKWIFPEYSLGSGQHLLVFASGKDRKDIVKHWETVITQGDEWRYCIPESETPETWRLVGFDDSGWDSGPSGFGFYYDLATTLPQTVSFYIRKSFTVNDIANITACLLQIDYDDAFVAYFNGTEIARANIGETGIPPPYDSKARKTRKVQLFEGGNPDVFEIENIQSLLVQGENVLAIQIHNIHPKNSTMAAIPFLTFGMTIPPPNPRGMPDFLKFSIKNYMHTNFKIKATGETLVLTDSSGDMCDRLETGYIPSDMSWGRQPDGGTQLVFFSNPTPGNSNTTTGQIFADSVTVSHSGGFYDSSISLTLSCNSSTAVIRYTKDGSDPTESSDEYYASIPIAETTVIKARAFETGLLPGKIAVHTYFINEKSTLPIISIATDPDGFFSSVKGIYLNEHQRTWEREVHLEYYEPNGHLGFSINAGTKIRGQSSSGFPQKSLSIFVRGQYGYEVINYQIFPDSPITEFKSLILRNSGNDWPYTMFRDGLNASLFKGVDLDIQEYRPAVVYINGKYWGIHNIREKYNEEYFESHHGADPDNIDFLELTHKSEHPGGALLIEGDYEHYDSMLEYMTDHDLSVDEYYNYIKTQMDIPSYINYMILEIHGSNGDWLGRNMKLWRPRTPEGKWRWLPFDLDFTFGGSVYFGNVNDMTGFNTLAYASDPSKCPWPAWTTFVFRKLLENRTFKYDFINRFADCMNTFLHTSVVMQKIHEVKSAIEPEMPNHIWRWNDSFGAINSMYQWNMEVQSVEEFCETRVDSLRTYISDEFNLSGTAQVNLNVSQPGTGIVILNTLTLDEFLWRGIYFKDVPVRITAQSSYGYRFAGWS